ncbi:MAG: hypothetical protein CML56_01655 [Rhodobacteraceae bacterium]|nr:hypothetical protein [Paracoccaceae bacterium]
MQTHTNSLDLSRSMSSVLQRTSDLKIVKAAKKQRRDTRQEAVLIEISSEMRQNSEENFAEHFNKFRHMYE